MTAEPKHAEKTLKIIMDANAFFIPFQFKIDIFEELEKLLERKLEFILLSPVHMELEKLRDSGSPKMQKNASQALKLAEKCVLVTINKQIAGSPDDIILEIASQWQCPVLTNDSQLRKRLRDINVPVIYVRQKSRLEIDGKI